LEQSLSGEQITKSARIAASRGFDLFIVVGGDGTVNYAVSGLINSDTALGVLPAGTANVWAQELCLDSLSWTRWMALENCSQALLDGSICSADVGICNGHPFLLWAGVGLDGYIVNNIEPRNRWKKTFSTFHYGASAVWYARTWKGSDMQIIVDGRRIQGHYLLVLVSNISLYAGGVIHLPTQFYLDDGIMDLWLLEGGSLSDTLQSAWDLLANRADSSSRIHRIPFRRLSLTSEAPIYGQVDGEPVEPLEHIEIKVESHALRVLVPHQISDTLFLAQPVM